MTNPLLFNVLFIAHELGKSIDEISDFTLPEIELWLAYFKVKADMKRKDDKREQQRQNAKRK